MPTPRTLKRRLQRKRLAHKIAEKQWFDALTPEKQARVLARRKMSPQAALNDLMDEVLEQMSGSFHASSALYYRLRRP